MESGLHPVGFGGSEVDGWMEEQEYGEERG
jgi:hypothetical protein